MNRSAHPRWPMKFFRAALIALACASFACDNDEEDPPDENDQEEINWEYPDPYADGDEVAWVVDTGATYARLPAVDADGGLVFGDWNGVVRRVNADTGAIDWTYEAAGKINSAVAIEEGRIYFGDWSGVVYALSSDGDELWTHDIEAGVDTSPSINAEGRILIGDLAGLLHIFSSDGDLEESIDLEAPVISAASIAVDGHTSTVYIATADDKVHCLHDEEDPASVTLEGETGFDLALSDTGDAIATTTGGGVARISPQCEILWQEDRTWAKLMPAITGDGDDLWVWGHNRQFYRMDATTGETTAQSGSPIRSNAISAPILADDGRVLVSIGGVIAYEGESSEVLSRVDALDSPVLINGSAYVTTERGVLLRLTGSWPEIGDSSWPTQHGNLARTGRLSF